MTDDKTLDEAVRQQQGSYDRETVDDVIERYSRTHDELRDTIAYLIRHRETLRDLELGRLRSEADRLIDKLRSIDQEKLVEELKCFRDILALQRRLIQETNGSEADRENRGVS